MKKIILFVALCMIGALQDAQAASWYLDGTLTTGTGAGTSWTNAFKSIATINWGGMAAGDVLFISGGSTGKSYAGTFAVGRGNVTIKAGQDNLHNGIVRLTGTLQAYQNYVTIDGEYLGQRHIVVENSIDLYGSTNPVVRYVEVRGTGLGIAAVFGRGGEFAYNYIHNITEEAAIQLNGRNQGVSDLTLIHHNEIQVNQTTQTVNGGGSGTGPDGIQGCDGLQFYDNYIYGALGTVTGAQHQDLIQEGGLKSNVKIYNNVFQDGADSLFDQDTMGSTTVGGGLVIAGNVFKVTNGAGGLASVRFYNTLGTKTVTAISDLWIVNNTFVDCALRSSSYGAAISFYGNSPTVTNTHIANNIFYNCGKGSNGIFILNGVSSAGFDFDYNLINAGPGGNSSSPWTQAHGKTQNPLFVSYAAGATANNFHLQLGSPAINAGTNSFASKVGMDPDNVTRGADGTWDIGAYEYVTGGVPGPVPNAPTGLRIN